LKWQVYVSISINKDYLIEKLHGFMFSWQFCKFPPPPLGGGGNMEESENRSRSFSRQSVGLLLIYFIRKGGD